MTLCSLLKIWNMNKFSGVVGVFNCQGAGIWPLRNGPEYGVSSTSKSLALSGHVSPQDIDFLGEVADGSWSGKCAVYAFHSGKTFNSFLYCLKIFVDIVSWYRIPFSTVKTRKH